MTTYSKFSLLLVIGFVLLFSGPVHSQFVTIARKIKSMHTSKSDIATVILEAKPYKVYETIIDTLTTNKKFEITSRDNVKRFVEFTNQTYKVSMQVDSLERFLTQITVASMHSDNSQKQATDVAVSAIIRICKLVGIKCTVDKQ
jgi:hypothetical protein